MRYIDLCFFDTLKSSWSAGVKNDDGEYEKWRCPKLKKDFLLPVGNKCWYSEVNLAGSYSHIDHFRPKAKVTKFQDFDYNKPSATCGYFWRANDYTNYRLSCAYSNSGKDDGGKKCYFPLLSNSYDSETTQGSEEPALLDPCNQNDVNEITFFAARVKSVKPSCDISTKRVTASVKIYNLDHPHIVQERSKVWNSVEKFFRQYNRQKHQYNSIETLKENLLDMIDKTNPFSACAIAAVKSFSLSYPGLLEELQLDLQL